MDATQKRRMWKVAFAHFALTIICGAILIITSFSSIPDFTKTFCCVLESGVFALLQPQFWIAPRFFNEQVLPNCPLIIIWMMFVLYFVSVPLWSYFFGKIFVKLDNWLNHFPVLGKKVF
jgi:hypothetical protein